MQTRSRRSLGSLFGACFSGCTGHAGGSAGGVEGSPTSRTGLLPQPSGPSGEGPLSLAALPGSPPRQHARGAWVWRIHTRQGLGPPREQPLPELAAGPAARAFSSGSGGGSTPPAVQPDIQQQHQPQAQPPPALATGPVVGAPSSGSGSGAASGSWAELPSPQHHLNDELEEEIQRRLPELQSQATRLPLPLAPPSTITRPPSQAVLADGAVALLRVLAAIQAAGAPAVADLEAAAALNEAIADTLLPALKPDPVKAQPPVIHVPYQVAVEQSAAAAKATAKKSLACENGALYVLVHDSSLPRDPRAGRSVVRDCARGGGEDPPERALLQPMNGSSYNGSPAIDFLPLGDTELHELPTDCRAFELSGFDKAGCSSTQDDDGADRLQFIGGTTSVRPVLNPSGGVGAAVARVAGGSLILVNPDGTEFKCELGFKDIKGCLEAVIQAALAAPRMPIIINHKSALAASGLGYQLKQ